MNKESVSLAYLVNPTQTCKSHHLHNIDNMTDINKITQVAKDINDYGMIVEIHYGKNKNILT